MSIPQFDPNRFYSEAELRRDGVFTEAILRKARKKGALRFQQIDRTMRVYKGSWLLAWLEGKHPEQTQ